MTTFFEGVIFNKAKIMKKNNYKIIKAISFCAVIIASSCTKNTNCTYETTCQETAPAGYMVGTMGSDLSTVPKNQVAAIFKTANNASAPIGDDWNDPALGVNRVQSIFPKYWVSDSIGQVFGIALDHNGGIYLSATDVYSMDYSGVGQPFGYGAAGAAAIYYTNYSNPSTTIPLVTTKIAASFNTVGTNQIPNSGISPGPGSGIGNSIGNIAFDNVHNQLFATNLEDGRIYRINPTNGKVKSIFDPFALDVAVAGMAGLGEQLWGIGVLTQGGSTSVYFARSTAVGKEIWSIQLDASGEFIATAAGAGLFTDIAISATKKQIAAVPGTQSKVTDIAFSSTGKMLLAERGQPHNSKIYEYVLSGITWGAGSNFYIGSGFIPPTPYPIGHNSSGGVDYSNREVKNTIPNFICDDIAWASGNVLGTQLLPYPGGSYPKLVYGVQGMSSSGNSSTLINNTKTDLYMDYNCTGNPTARPLPGSVKGKIGDVEFFDPVCPCK